MLTGPRGLFLTAAQEKVVTVALERVLTTPPVEDLTVHIWLEMGKLNMRTKLEGGSVPCGGSADGSADEIRS